MAKPRIHGVADAATSTATPTWNGNFKATPQGASQVCRVGDVVCVLLTGEATRRSEWGSTIATLPNGFRPAATLIVPLTGVNGTVVAHAYFYSSGKVAHTGVFDHAATVTTVATFQAA